MNDIPEKSPSIFGKLFSQNNRWWTLISIILAPFTGMLMALRSNMDRNSDIDSLFILFLGALFLSYIIVAVKHPQKPAWFSLIFTSTGSFLLIFAGVSVEDIGYDSMNPSYFWYLFMIIFFLVSLFPLAICFFLNRSSLN